MKRISILCLLAALISSSILPAPADAARRVVRRTPRGRAIVVVHRGWPIRRPLRNVIVHPVRVDYRVSPGTFLPLVVWEGVVVAAAPAPDALAWEDGETLTRDEDWTEFSLNCDQRGTKLWLGVEKGKVQFDWAEVVFENGDTQVVDLKEWAREPGLYGLLDFADGRKVDHVRLVARAKTDEARVVLKMQK